MGYAVRLLLVVGVICIFNTLQTHPFEQSDDKLPEFLRDKPSGKEWDNCPIDFRIQPKKGHHETGENVIESTYPPFHSKSIFSRDDIILPQIENYNSAAEKMIEELKKEAEEKLRRDGEEATTLTVNFKEFEKTGETFPSPLPEGLLRLLRNLCCVHTDAGSAFGKWRHASLDYRNLPLQLTTEMLLKGGSILKEIGGHVKEFDAMMGEDGFEKGKMAKLVEIGKLSERFHKLVPVYQKLNPIFQERDLRGKLTALNRLIHYERAKSLLLAAQFNMKTTNPFEYVYRCLGTKIQQLDGSAHLEDKGEMDMILKYVRNSGKNAKVHNIYRVEIGGENERMDNVNIGNRQLLWHGTGSPNLLSILQHGLQAAPLGSQINDHLFGKGIYLADMFEKSQHYCTTIEVNGQIRKYMLLVEAALGNIYEVEVAKAGDKPLPKSFSSLKTSDSRFEPDPLSTVMWKERIVALGERVEKPRKKADGSGFYNYGLDFNDYVVYDQDQVAVRYLIEFDDGLEKPT